MTTFNPDVTYYVVFNDHGARIGIGETVVSDRKELIDNIRRRENGFDNIVSVSAFNAFEGWAFTCTDDVMEDVEAEIQRRQDAEDFPVMARSARAREAV